MLHLENTNYKRAVNFLLRFVSLNLGRVHLARGTKLYADVTIAAGTRINGPAVMKGHGFVHVGKYCAIGDGLRLISSNHSLQQITLQNKLQHQLTGGSAVGVKRGITIGHDVWIGDGVMIMPGVEVGNGAVIGAGSVVTKSIVPYSVVAGNPAREIKQRFPSSVIELLQQMQWWDWDIERMKATGQLFNSEFSSLSEEQMNELIRSAMDHSGL